MKATKPRRKIHKDTDVEELFGKHERTDDMDPTTCGTCGRTWNDARVTAYTPTPGARCPFEYDHKEKPLLVTRLMPPYPGPELEQSVKDLLKAYAPDADKTAKATGEESLHSAVRGARAVLRKIEKGR